MAKRLTDALEIEIVERFLAGENAAKISKATGISEKRILELIMAKHPKVRSQYRKQRKDVVIRYLKLGLSNAQIAQELDETVSYVNYVRSEWKRLKDAGDC